MRTHDVSYGGTDAGRDRMRAIDKLGRLSRIGQVIFTPAQEGGNVWTKEALAEVLEVGEASRVADCA